MTGRPSIYTDELAKQICMRLASGESLRAICRDDDMPDRSTVHDWVINDLQGFSYQYARARDVGMDELADECFDIVDDGRNDWVERENRRTGEKYIALNDEAIARARLRFDARRWYLSKLAPKKYGERSAHEITNPDGSLRGMSNAQLAAGLNALAAAVGKPDELAAGEGDDGCDLV